MAATGPTPRRRFRRLLVVALTIGLIAAVREAMFVRNRRRYGP